MRYLAFLSIFLVAAASVETLSQVAPKAEIAAIDAYVRGVEAVRRKAKRPSSIFADAAEIDSETERWRQFDSEKALERHRRNSEVYTIAYNWLEQGKLVASNFTVSSPSGDWVKYNLHYFRTDGSLALIESDYRTFMGDFVVIRRRYFDAAGKQVHQTSKIQDLKTRKPKKAPDGVMGDSPDEIDYFMTTGKLPFAALLNSLKKTN